MPNKVQSRFDFAFIYAQMIRERVERSVRRRACTCDGRITFALPVTGIIAQKKCVAVLSILRDEPGPIERQRTVTAKRNPNTLWQTGVRFLGQIKRDLLASKCREVQLDAVLRQSMSVDSIVRPRVVEH